MESGYKLLNKLIEDNSILKSLLQKIKMKLFNTFLLNSCSFDNKSGIWENKNTSYEKIF